MPTTKQVNNVIVSYSINGESYTLATPTSATISDATEYSKVFNADGTGRGITQVTGKEAPDTVAFICNELSDSIVQAILTQQSNIDLGEQFNNDAVEGTLTLASKADPNDKLVLSYAVPSGATLVPEISTSAGDRYALELRGRITQNFKGNVD